MADQQPSLFTRIALAFLCLFKVMFNPRFAGRVQALEEAPQPHALPAGPETQAPEPASDPKAEIEARTRSATESGAVLILGLLQQEGRLIDFVQQDISQFSDAEIGAVARVVHDGCKRMLDAHMDISPVRAEEENTQVRVDEGYDIRSLKLIGNVQGSPPYTGTLRHRGWQAKAIKLPQRLDVEDSRAIAPAEVEL